MDATESIPTPTLEDQLVREKAARMTLLELRAEVERCRNGIEVAANAAARARFTRRLAIMETAIELLTRAPGV
jgi:hypothetical protein